MSNATECRLAFLRGLLAGGGWSALLLDLAAIARAEGGDESEIKLANGLTALALPIANPYPSATGNAEFCAHARRLNETCPKCMRAGPAKCLQCFDTGVISLDLDLRTPDNPRGLVPCDCQGKG